MTPLELPQTSSLPKHYACSDCDAHFLKVGHLYSHVKATSHMAVQCAHCGMGIATWKDRLRHYAFHKHALLTAPLLPMEVHAGPPTPERLEIPAVDGEEEDTETMEFPPNWWDAENEVLIGILLSFRPDGTTTLKGLLKVLQLPYMTALLRRVVRTDGSLDIFLKRHKGLFQSEPMYKLRLKAPREGTVTALIVCSGRPQVSTLPVPMVFQQPPGQWAQHANNAAPKPTPQPPVEESTASTRAGPAPLRLPPAFFAVPPPPLSSGAPPCAIVYVGKPRPQMLPPPPCPMPQRTPPPQVGSTVNPLRAKAAGDAALVPLSVFVCAPNDPAPGVVAPTGVSMTPPAIASPLACNPRYIVSLEGAPNPATHTPHLTPQRPQGPSARTLRPSPLLTVRSISRLSSPQASPSSALALHPPPRLSRDASSDLDETPQSPNPVDWGFSADSSDGSRREVSGGSSQTDTEGDEWLSTFLGLWHQIETPKKKCQSQLSRD
jgi:DNA-directed RNA polymerase subunit RPC12/RpoP